MLEQFKALGLYLRKEANVNNSCKANNTVDALLLVLITDHLILKNHNLYFRLLWEVLEWKFKALILKVMQTSIKMEYCLLLDKLIMEYSHLKFLSFHMLIWARVLSTNQSEKTL